jgi:hypothetical protein
MDGEIALVHLQGPFALKAPEKKNYYSSILPKLETAFPQQQGLSLQGLYY